jgi:hypothetical protein
MLQFSDFVASSSFNTVVANSKTALKIYNEIIWRDEVRIGLVYLSNARLPALSACAKEIEQICSSGASDLDLTNPTVKQTIGRMVSASMEPFGYVSRKGRKARMPQSLNVKFFKYAHVFDYAGGEKQKIERRIVNI